MIHVKGDLFEIARIASQAGQIALGHGVNCRGVMGAGIALEFRDRFPANYTEYRHQCYLFGDGLAGSSVIVNDVLEINKFKFRPITIVNLFSQIETGPDAKINLLTAALIDAFTDLRQQGLTIPLLIPMIGAGIGGLTPSQVLEVFDTFEDNLVVVEYDR